METKTNHDYTRRNRFTGESIELTKEEAEKYDESMKHDFELCMWFIFQNAETQAEYDSLEIEALSGIDAPLSKAVSEAAFHSAAFVLGWWGRDELVLYFSGCVLEQ